tara:strand:- start:859 stop:1638 length:780 start_codon:yes stop_codon:yes gene_type:complete
VLIDSHCHLDFNDFIDDLPFVIERANVQGIMGIQTICTRLSEFEKVWNIANSNHRIWCSIGVHPHNVEAEMPYNLNDLTSKAKRDKVIGIGETGLDFFYENSKKEYQYDSFRLHIDAAKKSGLPLIIHSRSADRETCKTLRDEYSVDDPFSGVMHSFTAGEDLAICALELGLYISFSGIITFKNASNVRDICRLIPINRILVESDSPYLAPVPNRGKRNEPGYLGSTLSTVASIKGVSDSVMAKQSTENFFTLFNKAKL